MRRTRSCRDEWAAIVGDYETIQSPPLKYIGRFVVGVLILVGFDCAFCLLFYYYHFRTLGRGALPDSACRASGRAAPSKTILSRYLALNDSSCCHPVRNAVLELHAHAPGRMPRGSRRERYTCRSRLRFSALGLEPHCGTAPRGSGRSGPPTRQQVPPKW